MCLRTFRGLKNYKNFVGLTVSPNYIACGESQFLLAVVPCLCTNIVLNSQEARSILFMHTARQSAILCWSTNLLPPKLVSACCVWRVIVITCGYSLPSVTKGQFLERGTLSALCASRRYVYSAQPQSTKIPCLLTQPCLIN